MPKYVQSAQSTGDGTAGVNTVQLTGVQARGLLVGAVKCYGAAAATTIEDSLGDPVVKGSVTLVAGDHYLFYFYILNPTAGTHTITATNPAGDTVTLMVEEVGEFWGGVELDAAPASAGPTTGTSVTSASITTTAPDSFVFSCLTVGLTTQTFTPTGGTTLRQLVHPTEERLWAGDQVRALPGAFADTWTLGTSDTWATWTMSFKSRLPRPTIDYTAFPKPKLALRARGLQ